MRKKNLDQKTSAPKYSLLDKLHNNRLLLVAVLSLGIASIGSLVIHLTKEGDDRADKKIEKIIKIKMPEKDKPVKEFSWSYKGTRTDLESEIHSVSSRYSHCEASSEDEGGDFEFDLIADWMKRMCEFYRDRLRKPLFGEMEMGLRKEATDFIWARLNQSISDSEQLSTADSWRSSTEIIPFSSLPEAFQKPLLNFDPSKSHLLSSAFLTKSNLSVKAGALYQGKIKFDQSKELYKLSEDGDQHLIILSPNSPIINPDADVRNFFGVPLAKIYYVDGLVLLLHELYGHAYLKEKRSNPQSWKTPDATLARFCESLPQDILEEFYAFYEVQRFFEWVQNQEGNDSNELKHAIKVYLNLSKRPYHYKNYLEAKASGNWIDFKRGILEDYALNRFFVDYLAKFSKEKPIEQFCGSNLIQKLDSLLTPNIPDGINF